jgi:hypothetical protein
MLSTALALAEKGFRIFPCAVRGKTPATPNGCKDATSGVALIKQWWEHEPRYNIGLATGSPSGVFVIDIDGLEAEAALKELERELGALPSTVEALTARGRHLYFSMPADVSVRNSASQVAPHIDVRGTGGYVLTPPSVHPSGKIYSWSVDCASVIAEAPPWLIKKVTAPANGASAATAPSVWRELVHDGVGEGARNDALTRLSGYLLVRLVDPFVTLGLLQAWNSARCSPPLPEADVARIVNSIAGRELARRDSRDGA